jgi:hypothetical protein
MTSFGYGAKSDFTKTAMRENPAPGQYETLAAYKSPQGKSFGVSREQSPWRSYIVRDPLKFPGPGKYNTRARELSNISFSMRPKVPDVAALQNTSRQAPGPGAYEPVGVGKRAPFSYSISRRDRFENIKQSPGPLDYICTSPRASSFAFPRAARGEATARREQRPGPADYECDVEFGITPMFNTRSNFGQASSPLSHRTIG